MKLVRYGSAGEERPGLIDADGGLRDLGGALPDLTPDAFHVDRLDALRRLDPASLPLVAERDLGPLRLGAPLADTPNFFCVGLNYSRHAAETGAPTPAEPVLFNKATSALSGPFDPIEIPPGAERVDWEVELGLVIGRPASRVSETEALDHVAGYMLVNDLSERHFQAERGGQWVKGKSAPGFGKIGPYLITADEISNPQSLRLWTKLNGRTMQSSSTADMIFSVAEIISHVSFFLTLRVGDVIATGTPEGVGLGMTPPRFLRPGDRLEIGADMLGAQAAEVV
ncbi:MAG: fumarylacetoacetate hydrolase family protein [Pseudomonadota bacterium]